MADIFTAIKDGAKAGWCEAIGRQNFGFGLFKSLPVPGFQAVGGVLDPLYDFSKGLEAAVCNRPPEQPAFTGGAGGCDGVTGATHKATISVRNNPFSCEAVTISVWFNGPGSVSTTGSPISSCGGYERTWAGNVVAHNYAAGNAIVYTNTLPAWELYSGGVASPCGAAPTVAPGDDETTSTQPVNGTDTPISYKWRPAYNAPDGSVRSPFSASFDVGGVTVNVTGNLNLSTGDVFIGTPPSGGSQGSGPLTSDGAPDDPTNTDDANDETADKGVIRAALVTVTAGSSRVGSVDNGSIPDLFVPRLGRVSFLIRVEDTGELAWTSPQDIKLEREYFVCPGEQGAIDVQAYFVGGVSGEVTPIRVKPEPVIVES